MAVETRFAFTKTKLAGLPIPATGRTVYYDTNTPGLILRITEKGQRSFYFYRKVKGRPIRHLLGKFPETSVEKARTACQVKSGDAAKGVDLQAVKQAARHEQTVGGLFTFWLEDHAKQRNKTWAEDENRYKRFLKPWANRKLSSVKESDMQSLFTRVGRNNGHYAANRLLALVRAMFNKAPKMGFSGSNPTKGIKKFPEEKRDRFLHGNDLRVFFTALAADPNESLRDYFMVCLLSGARKANVLAMRWEQVDFSTKLWRIPGEDAKAGVPIVIPLVGPLMQLLEARQLASKGSPWVFPSHGKTGHIVEPKSAWKRIIDRAGLVDVRPHDLRRSLASWMTIGGAGLPIVGKMLGHTQPSTTAIYARLSVDPVRAAAEAATSAMLTAGGQTQLLEAHSEPIKEGSSDE